MAEPSRRVLRSSDIDIFLIGSIAINITGAKLPSREQVLKVFFYNNRVVNMNPRDSARLAVREAAIFWEKAKIPMKQEHRCVDTLMDLYKRWENIRKSCNRRNEKQDEIEKCFKDELDELFDIAHGNAMELMKNERDREFLRKQREKGRPGSMAGVDVILALKEQKKQARMAQEEQRKRKYYEAAIENGL